MQEILDAIRGNADVAARSLQELLEVAGRTSMDLSDYRTSLGLSADMVVARSNALIEGARSLAEIDPDRLLMAPTSHVSNLRDQLNSVAAAIDSISQILRNLEPDGIASADQSSGAITGKNGATVNARGPFDDLAGSIDRSLDAYLVIANVAQPRGIGTYAAASRAMTKNAADSGELLSDLKREASEFAKKVSQLEEKAASMTQANGEAQRLLEEIEKARRTSDENEQRILTAATIADESRSKAAIVDAQVQAYEDQFKTFQTLIDNRENAIKKGEIIPLRQLRLAVV